MMNRRSCKDLQKSIKLEIDGKVIDLPPCEGIIILNILRLLLLVNLYTGQYFSSFYAISSTDNLNLIEVLFLHIKNLKSMKLT